MTVFELHLGVEQKLQEQGSYQHDRIFPEAIDLALNQAETELLEAIITEHLAGNYVRLKHLLPIMFRNETLLGIQNYVDLEANSAVTRVPAYVRHVLNCRGQAVTSKTCSNITTVTSSAGNFITANIPFSESSGNAPYYNNFRITKQNGDHIYVAPAQFNNRFSSKEQKYELIQDILDTLNIPKSGYEVRWDGQSFTIISTTNPGTLTVSYDNKTAVPATASAATGELVHNISAYTSNPDLTIGYVPAKYAENDHSLYAKIHLNKFTAPKQKEPLYTLSNDLLYIFYHKDSIVTNVQVDYIRNPKKISLILNRTSELDPTVHQQIVNRAAEILKQNIQDPSVQADVQLNQLNTRK